LGSRQSVKKVQELLNNTILLQRTTHTYFTLTACCQTAQLPTIFTAVSNKSALSWIIFIALALTWGSSFILMKRGMDAFSSSQVAALRIGMAFLFLLPLAVKHYSKELWSNWKAAAAMGIFGNLIPAFLFTKAETMISSALTGMLNSLTPLFTLVTGLVMFRLRVSWLQICGIVIGLVSTMYLLLIGGQVNDSLSNALTGGGLVILATVGYGFSVNIIKSKLSHLNAVGATLLAMSIIGPFAITYLFTTDFIDVMQAHPKAWSSLGYVAILAILGTALSVIVYNILIRDAGVLFAASVTYAIPIVAMMWGLFDGEYVTWMHALLILGILSGVWMVNKKNNS
jgi:drug/metabolite transporter (DMT)-like permease